MTIGPHEGRELSLMLAGRKRLAAFGDILTGPSIPEDIIPDRTFAPYVATGLIARFEKKFFSKKMGADMLYICFTLPGDEWRAQAFFWIREATHNGSMPDDDAADIMVGRLLNYDEKDIEEFVNQ